MRLRLLDLLACPACRHFPLQLHIFEETVEEVKAPGSPPLCEFYCAYKGGKVGEVGETPCEECVKRDIVTGLLACPSCGAWYPIIDSIPRMLPPGHPLRSDKQYREALERYADKLPGELRSRVFD